MSQGWSKIFNRINWLNRPSTNTPLNATNLNAGDSAIDKLDDRIITLDTVKADMQVVNGMVADVSLNSNTGVITVTYKNGSHVDYDTNLEKIAVNFSYDYVNQRLVLTLPDGTTQYVDMSALITQYEFKDSTTIAFSVDSTGKISASVKNGSITEAMLETGYLANITAQATKAESMANSATTSSNSAYDNAKLSQSYAIGGAGVRDGEDTDNAMYYYEQAKKTDIGQIRSEVDELNSNLSQQSIEAMDLKMLGWTVPRECPVQNEVNGNQFTQNVNRIDMGKSDWSNQDNTGLWRFSIPTDANKPISLGYSPDFEIFNSSSFAGTQEGKINLGHSAAVFYRNSQLSDVDAVKSFMNGKYLYYKVSNPITKIIDGNEAVTVLNNDLCGLSFSVSGTTLSITDGTNTWTLSN